MENLEYLLDRKRIDNERNQIDSLRKEVGEWEIEYRKLKALEIIAEELIKTNGILENIESATFIKLRG